MIAALALALLPEADLKDSGLEERIRRGGESAAELIQEEARPPSRDLAADLSRISAAGDVLLVIHHGGAVPARWAGERDLVLDEGERLAVIEAWESLPSLHVRAALERVVADPDQARMRSASIELLGYVADAADLDLLFRLAPTLNARPEVTVERRLVLRAALDQIVARDRWALEGLRRFFVPANALWLGTIVQVAEAAPWDERLEFLGSLLSSVPPMSPIVLSAIARLGRTVPHPTSESVRSKVRSFLDRADPRLVLAAAKAVGNLEDYDSVESLVELLDHKEKNIRRASLDALQGMTGLAFRKAERWARWYYEQEVWWDEQSTAVFQTIRSGNPAAAVQELSTLGARRYRRHLLANEVASGLERRDPGLVRLTCAVLEQLGSPLAVPPLQRALSHPSEEVRQAASKALDRIRDRALASRRPHGSDAIGMAHQGTDEGRGTTNSARSSEGS